MGFSHLSMSEFPQRNDSLIFMDKYAWGKFVVMEAGDMVILLKSRADYVIVETAFIHKF